MDVYQSTSIFYNVFEETDFLQNFTKSRERKIVRSIVKIRQKYSRRLTEKTNEKKERGRLCPLSFTTSPNTFSFLSQQIYYMYIFTDKTVSLQNQA